jgi:hypothetical protein
MQPDRSCVFHASTFAIARIASAKGGAFIPFDLLGVLSVPPLAGAK